MLHDRGISHQLVQGHANYQDFYKSNLCDRYILLQNMSLEILKKFPRKLKELGFNFSKTSTCKFTNLLHIKSEAGILRRFFQLLFKKCL